MMKTLIIRRKKWLHGKVSGSMLLNDKGKMCCLGFYAQQIGGLKPNQILGMRAPESLGKLSLRTLRKLVYKDGNGEANNTDHCYTLMSVNDDHKIGDKRRERQLTDLFKKIKVAVKFVGKYR